MLKRAANLDLSDTSGHRPATAAYRRTVAAMLAAGMSTFSLMYSTQALLPDIAHDLNVSAAASALTVSLATAGLGLALLPAARLSERFGRTALIHGSMTASTIMALLCAVAPNWPILLLLRFACGVALAGVPAVSVAYLREEIHESAQGRAIGAYVAGTALGGMTGRLVTGFVAQVSDWRWAVASVAMIALVCAMVCHRYLPVSHTPPCSPAGQNSTVSALRAILRDRQALGLSVTGALAVGVLMSTLNTIGFRLTAAPFSLGVGTAGLVFLVYPMGAASSATAGRLADRVGRAPVLVACWLVTLGGAVLTLVDALPVLVVGLAALVAGYFGLHGTASAGVAARADDIGTEVGRASALYLVIFYVSSSFFGGLAGSVWSFGGWEGVVTLLLGLLFITGCTILIVIARKRPRHRGRP